MKIKEKNRYLNNSHHFESEFFFKFYIVGDFQMYVNFPDLSVVSLALTACFLNGFAGVWKSITLLWDHTLLNCNSNYNKYSTFPVF